MSDHDDCEYDLPTATCEECGHTVPPSEYDESNYSDEGYFTCPECGHTDIG